MLKRSRKPANAARVIKKYAARKMYDVESSKFITLAEIAELVAGGKEIQVIDDKTGDDITMMVLTQIILEQQRRGITSSEQSISSVSKLLRKIVKKGTESIFDVSGEPVFGPLGIISLTERKAKEIIGRLVKIGQVSKGERDNLLKELLVKVEESKRELENFVSETLTRMNIPTRIEFEKLKTEIEKLKKQIVKESN